METEKSPVYFAQPSPGINYKHPLVLGLGSMVLGFCLGSGRWSWLGRGTSRIVEDVGNLVTTAAIQAFQTKNPNLFSEFTSKH